MLKKRREGWALDFGCGERGLIPELAEHYEYVVGIDMCLHISNISWKDYSLRKAKSLTKRLKLTNVDLVRADCSKPPFRSNTFTAIVCTNVLEHLMNPQDSLEQIKKMLKPNGLVFIEVPSLSEIFGSTFNPNPIMQCGKVLLTRALDDLIYHRPSILRRLFFSFNKETNTVKMRKFIPRYYYAMLWYKRNISIEEYANSFLQKELLDPHHKHWFTTKEWVKLTENAGLTVIVHKGLATVYIVARAEATVASS